MGDADNPWAKAVASRDGRIIAVGSDAKISVLIGAETQVLKTIVGGNVVFSAVL